MLPRYAWFPMSAARMEPLQTGQGLAAEPSPVAFLDDTGRPAVGPSCYRCLRREARASSASGASFSPGASAPPTRGSVWFLITAVAAWLGMVTVYLFAAVVPPDPQSVETLYGYDGISTAHRVFQTAFYFTVLSVTVVAIASTMLWRDSARNTFWFAVLRLDALVMIVVTGLVYAVVLAPTSTATGGTSPTPS
jgi:NADH:ubiquinone oxidoreductase subunit 3 (subunit A)